MLHRTRPLLLSHLARPSMVRRPDPVNREPSPVDARDLGASTRQHGITVEGCERRRGPRLSSPTIKLEGDEKLGHHARRRGSDGRGPCCGWRTLQVPRPQAQHGWPLSRLRRARRTTVTGLLRHARRTAAPRSLVRIGERREWYIGKEVRWRASALGYYASRGL